MVGARTYGLYLEVAWNREKNLKQLQLEKLMKKLVFLVVLFIFHKFFCLTCSSCYLFSFIKTRQYFINIFTYLACYIFQRLCMFIFLIKSCIWSSFHVKKYSYKPVCSVQFQVKQFCISFVFVIEILQPGVMCNYWMLFFS